MKEYLKRCVSNITLDNIALVKTDVETLEETMQMTVVKEQA